MECREFQITLVSAQNLENVRQFFKKRVRVYAKVSLGGNHRTEKTTPVDKEGQTNPVWNFSASYIIGKNAVKSQDVKLLIQFFCIRTSRDTNIGEVSVSLKELFDRFSTLPQGEGTARVSYPVKKGAADSQGEVGFSFKFGDIFAFVPPPTDWGKVCWQGTKLIAKGGMLCVRLTLLANGNIFDVPIDAVAEIAHTSYDILSHVFGSGGDFLADIPWGEPDLPVDISCPVDTTSSLQTNVYAGSNVPADSTNVGAGSNVLADDTSAGTNLPVDDLYIPSAGIQAPVDATSFIETNVAAEVSFLGEDVPMAINAASCEVPMDATFSGETNMIDNISCLQANVEMDAIFNGETNVPGHISSIEPDARVDATFSGEMDVSYDISYA